MGELRLMKLFAWTIGVLILLWMLTECLGGVDETDPGNQDFERDAEQYAADCERTWEALELVAGVDHGNVEGVLDRLDTLATEVADPNLKATTTGFADQAQQMVAAVPEGDADALERARADFREAAAFDLAMRCPVR